VEFSKNMEYEYNLTFSEVFGVPDHESGLIFSNFLPLTPRRWGWAWRRTTGNFPPPRPLELLMGDGKMGRIEKKR